MGSFLCPIEGPGSQVEHMSSVQDLESQIPRSNFRVEPRVSDPTFRVLGLRFRALPLGWVSGRGSWVPGPSYSTGFRVPLFGYARNNSIQEFVNLTTSDYCLHN